MNVLLTGSVAYDYLMTFPGYFREHILPDRLESISLSFLVDSMVKERGGIAPNIAYTMALLGEKPRVFATVGEDFEQYRIILDKNGVDTTEMRVMPGEFTASFFVTTDRANAQIASFYPGAMGHAATLSLHNLVGHLPDLVVISPNDPQAMHKLIMECRELKISYLYDPSQQVLRFEGEPLREGISSAYALFVNDYEFGLIQKKTGYNEQNLIDQLKLMVVTKGEAGSVIYTAGEQILIPVIAPEVIVDPTGVGDAFRGGFLTGLSHDLTPEACGMIGAMAATYCLENKGTQKHYFTPFEFVNRLRRFYDDKDSLNCLLPEKGN